MRIAAMNDRIRIIKIHNEATAVAGSLAYGYLKMKILIRDDYQHYWRYGWCQGGGTCERIIVDRT